MKKKILVVDNHPVILKYMTTLLGKEGHQVKTAEDGLSALDILMTYIPDVMFIDLIMPNINGEQLCRIIRKMPALKNTYAVILSATMAEKSRDFTELGADAFIVKGPFNEMAKHVLAAIEQSDHDIPMGAPEEIMGVKDVYKREITKELISAKGHLEAILRNISDAIIELAPEGRIIFANPAAVSLMDLPEEELLGSKFTELINEGDRKRIEAFLIRIDEGSHKVDLDTPVLINSRQISLSMLPVKEDVSPSVMLVLNDITEAMQAETILKREHAELERRVRERTIELAKTNKQLEEEIHNRTSAEKVLKTSQQRLSQIINFLPDATMVIDLEGKVIAWNRAIENMTGIKTQDMLGKGNYEYAIPFYGERRPVLIDLVGQWNKEIEKKYQYIKKEGESLVSETCDPLVKSGAFLWNKASLLYDDNGEVIGAIESIRDITDRKVAEEALQESEERYRTLVDNLPVAVYRNVPGPEGQFLMANPAFCKMFGFKNEEDAKEAAAADLYANRKERQRYSDNLIEKGVVENDERRMVKRDGTPIHTSITSRVVYGKDGEISHFDSIMLDISEQRIAEEALRESEEKYRLLVENANDAIFVAQDGVIRFPNAKAEQLTGYSAAELEKIPFVNHIHPDDREMVMERHKRRLEGEDLVSSYSYRAINKTGEELWHLLNTVSITWEGRPATLNFVRDITEAKRLEDQFQQSDKMEAIAILAGGIAHEFNNALMGIMGNIELLKMDLPADERRDKYFGAMKGSGHRMSRLTDQLLAYAQGGKYQPKNLKLDDFVIETLPILQHDLGPEIRVETHFPKVSYIKADYAQMQMVLSAILANANEAIEDAGLIRITAGNKDIDKDFTKQHPGLKPGYYVCLTIEDDGKGMDEETKDGIFEPFFTTKFQGRGMGMAAVYGIVKNHHGWIYVESELGKGTTVQIYLPAIEVELTKPKKAEVEIATGSGTILMIEDEDVVIEVTQAMLEMLGYRVMAAKTGKDAIHITETFDGRIDLALLDIKLPDMEGGKVYPLIMKARPDLKVIVFSGYSIEGPARKILDAGAQDFIQKPFSLATLSEKLKEVLDAG